MVVSVELCELEVHYVFIHCDFGICTSVHINMKVMTKFQDRTISTSMRIDSIAMMRLLV